MPSWSAAPRISRWSGRGSWCPRNGWRRPLGAAATSEWARNSHPLASPPDGSVAEPSARASAVVEEDGEDDEVDDRTHREVDGQPLLPAAAISLRALGHRGPPLT